MAIRNTRLTLVCAALGVCNLLVAGAPQAQGVSFQAARTFEAGSYPYSVAVGDFNGDGVQDLAVANLSSNYLSVLLGNGDGTFQVAQNLADGSGYSVAVGDFRTWLWPTAVSRCFWATETGPFGRR